MSSNTDNMELLTAEDVRIGHILQGNSATYTVVEILGQGCFGKVARCQNLQTKEMVAVKILIDPNAIKEADREVSMSEAVNALDSDRSNVVKFFGRFEDRGLTCMAFEMLHTNLYDFIENREWEPLTTSEIRPIAQQLLVALDSLKTLGVVHTDLKMDNVMLTNTTEQPLRVKLIDFGQAMYTSEVRPGMYVQPCGSMSPEVALGNMFNEAIDIFSLGCGLAFLYLGYFLFPTECDYQMVKRMVEILGYPPENLLSNGLYTKIYFKEVEDEDTWSTTWTLRTPEEYETVTKNKTEEYRGYGCELKSLDDLVDVYPKYEDDEYEDRKAFVDLLKGLLHLDPRLRLSPKQALHHPFITMSHLQDHDYLMQSEKAMEVCQTTVSCEGTAMGPNKDGRQEDTPIDATTSVLQLAHGGNSDVWSEMGVEDFESSGWHEGTAKSAESDDDEWYENPPHYWDDDDGGDGDFGWSPENLKTRRSVTLDRADSVSNQGISGADEDGWCESPCYLDMDNCDAFGTQEHSTSASSLRSLGEVINPNGLPQEVIQTKTSVTKECQNGVAETASWSLERGESSDTEAWFNGGGEEMTASGKRNQRGGKMADILLASGFYRKGGKTTTATPTPGLNEDFISPTLRPIQKILGPELKVYVAHSIWLSICLLSLATTGFVRLIWDPGGNKVYIGETPPYVCLNCYCSNGHLNQKLCDF